MKANIHTILYPLGALSILVLLWHLLVVMTGVHESLLPGPLVVWQALVEVASSGDLARHASASIYRVLFGFVLAACCAIPLGLLVGTKRHLQAACGPLIEALRTISPISWIPLAILWFGVGNTPAVFIIFITAFFPLVLSTALAIQHVDPTLVRVARNFGATSRQLLTKIILPSITPYIIIGLKVSLGISWVIIVAAEMVGMSSGLG